MLGLEKGYNMEAFSKTEKQVLEMRISGLSRKEIADKMFRSEKTVQTHFQNALRKTKAKDEIDLVVWFLKVEKGVFIAMIIVVILTYSGIDFIEILRKLSETVQNSLYNVR